MLENKKVKLTKEEKQKKKLIEKIKKKEEKMNKVKEEIKKMAIELKDGKLVKTDKKAAAGAPQQPQVVPLQMAPQQAPPPQMAPQQAPPQMAPPQAPPPQGPNPFDAAVPPQEFAQEPQMAQEPQQTTPEGDVEINFMLMGGMQFQFVTQASILKDVLKYIASGINNQETIELGNRLLNSRHIIYYEY